jgi:hypothetical protein
MSTSLDFGRTKLGRRANGPGSGWLWRFIAAGVGASVCVLGATHASGAPYVPPTTWPLVVGVSVLAYGAAALFELLWTALATPARSRAPRRIWGAVPLGVFGAVLLVGWFAPAGHTGPSDTTAAADVGILRGGVPLTRCHAVPVADEPTRILRDTVLAQVACNEHGITGEFTWFNTADMLRVYASARANSWSSIDFSGSSCGSGQPFSGGWHMDVTPSVTVGQLICLRIGHVSEIEWSDSRSSVYSVVKSRESLRKLVRWWTHHGTIYT